MKQLPEFLREEISEHETTVYWTRRATYEVIEEIGEGSFAALCWTLFVVWLVDITNSLSPLWGLTLLIFAVIYIGWELVLWYHEVYIVTEFEFDKGGTCYKSQITKSWKVKKEEVAINPSFSGINSERSLSMILWGWLTGEKFERVTIGGAGGLISGVRMPVQLRRAIHVVKGSPPAKAIEDDPRIIKVTKDIRTSMMSGAIPDWYGESLLEKLYNDIVYGEGG